MFKKVVITSNHPAHYMDILFNGLKYSYELTVIYNDAVTKEKPWKETNFFPGKVVGLDSFIGILNDLLRSDLVIIGGWGSYTNLFFIFLLILFRKRFAVFSDVPDVNDITLAKKILKRFAFLFFDNLFITGVSCHKHFTEIYKIPPQRIKIFPYPCRVPDPKSVVSINEGRSFSLKNICDEKINIFIANRFIKRKGYDVIYNAFNLLDKAGSISAFRVRIAGNGVEFDKYRNKFLSLSVPPSFLGWIEDLDYLNNLVGSDVLIHASDFEPYGIPVVDAMLHGKLVIASTGVMAAVDQIHNGYNGFLFEKGDSYGLYLLLLSISNNKNLIYQMGAEAAVSTNMLGIVQNKLAIDLTMSR